MLGAVLDWGEQLSEGGPTATSVRPANEPAIAILERRGYEPDIEAAWMLLNVRDLDEIEEPGPSAGYELTTMADVRDVERRVAVHRAAWERSRVTTELYEKIMRTWPYRADLDCVVEAPDGTLVASAIAWFDPDNRLGELEPVGTHPDYRLRGLGRAVNLFALRQLRAAGAREAIVACRGDSDYPIPKLLYESVGFCELSRQRRYIRR
jgi:ribosomal protein S18 acetylase RimI-like enzyme